MGLVTDGGGGVLFGDDPDGTGNSAIAGLPPGTPEYQKIRLAMEQIHASAFSVTRLSVGKPLAFVSSGTKWNLVRHLGFF